MVVTLGQQYNVGEKPTVILYTYYINHHAQPPIITQHNHAVIDSYGDSTNNVGNSSIESCRNRGLGKVKCTLVYCIVVVFTLKAVPVSTQYFLTSVLVQLTRTPSVVTG